MQAAEDGKPAALRHWQLPRYGAVYLALAAGVVAFGLAFISVANLATEIGAVVFFLTYLASLAARLPRLTQRHLRAHADESDTPGYFILVAALFVLAVNAAALLTLINGAQRPNHLDLGVGIAALVLGWLAIHAMLAFHYAYEYYETDRGSPVGKDGNRPHVGGLDFPGREAPDGLSFLYFSFVIAMTAQVSDVTVTSNAMRRLVLLHGILAFFFNAVILAVAVNVVVSLGH